MRRSPGFTLIEMMVAIVILLVAVLAATSLMIGVAVFTRNTESAADGYDNGRMAGETLIRSIQSAGLGAPGGIWINAGSSTPTLSYPLFGIDGTTGNGTGQGGTATPNADGSDELWVLVPDRNALREPCVDPGAGVPVTSASSSTPLHVQCSSITTFLSTDFLLATNTTFGALLSPPLSFSPGQITYTQDPGKGYTPGNLVYRVNPVHYFLRKLAGSNVKGLFRHRGKIATDTFKRPLSDDPSYGDEMVQNGIEDLQIAYGFDPNNTGDPAQYTYLNYLPPEFAAFSSTGNGDAGSTAIPAGSLRSVRINVVSKSLQVKRGSDGTATMTALIPLAVENNGSSGAPDGYQRSVFTRRVELPNLAPMNL